MADDESPPPPPSSPPPSAENGDSVQDTRSSFKSLQQMLAKSSTMYTSNRPAPPPKPVRPAAALEHGEIDQSPKLEHRTKERPRRKTRVPSRSALRERAYSSSFDQFTNGSEQDPVPGAPPPTNVIPMPPLMQSHDIDDPSPASPPPSPSPSPPPSPPPSSPPSDLKNHRVSTQPTLHLSSQEPPNQPESPSTKPSDKPTGDIHNELGSGDKPLSTPKDSHFPRLPTAHLQSKSSPTQLQPLISVVPFKGGEKLPTTGVQLSATFTSRLQQIRERRAARKSPSPSALSPTHSASSLPQRRGTLPESATEQEMFQSSLPLSSLSVSPVTSQASLDSSVRREGGTDPHSDQWSPSLQEVSTSRRLNGNHREGIQKRTGIDKLDSSNPPSLPSSAPPSPPPSPPPPLPPSPPPSLPPTLPPTITATLTPTFPLSTLAQLSSLSSIKTTTSTTTEVHTIVNSRPVKTYKARDLRDSNLKAHNSSAESLSSSSDSAPEPPPVPPPLALETTETSHSPTLPIASEVTPSVYLQSPPLLPDIAETTSVTSDSSAPPSSISTPRMSSGPVQLRHHQKPKGYRPERRSAFEAMLISESSEGQERLSVAERRALTLQASRRPDAASQSPMKRWSDTDDLLSCSSPGVEDNRAKSAMAMLGISDRGPVAPTGMHRSPRKHKNVSNDFLPEIGSTSTASSELPDSHKVSSTATERTKEGAPCLTHNESADNTKGVISDPKSLHHDITGLEGPQKTPPSEVGEAEREPGLAEIEKQYDRQEQEEPPPELATDYYHQEGREGELGRESDNETWDNSDDLENDPNTWSVEQVCEWLELVGLGTYRDVFRENGVDGATLVNMDVHVFAELGVDSPEIRELFLSKIYELSNPTRNMDSMQDDFCLEVDSYTEQDWKKLEAAVDALKSPVLRDDIELDPSAIGQFLHTDYLHSRSTPNIHQLGQLVEPHSDPELATTNDILPPVPHSTTVHSFPDYGPTSQAVSTDQVRRKKSRVPSTRSIQRQYILTMAEAGDRPRVKRHSASSHTTRRNSTESSQQGSPSLGSRHSAIELSMSPPCQNGAVTSRSGEGRKKRRSKVPADESSQSSAVSYGPMTAQLTKDLNQGVVVLEEGKYQRTTLGSYLKKTKMASTADHTTGLVRLYMENVQEGLHYKAFLVTESTSAAELVEKALERSHITDNPLHYCMWQVIPTNTELSRELAPSDRPLTLQLDWPQGNSHFFQLRLKDDVQRAQFLLDLPLCSKTHVKLTLPTSASTAEAVQSILTVLDLSDTFSQRGIHCALMDVTSRTRAERALAEKECPVSLLKTGHRLKLVSLSVNKRHSAGQADASLMTKLHRLEQEKAMLTQQLESAQSMLRTHHKAQQQQRRLSSDTAGLPGTFDQLQQEREKLPQDACSGEDGRAMDEAQEQVIQRLRGLNTALNNQLQQERENTAELTLEKQRLEKSVLELTSRDKEMILEIGVHKATITELKEQLSDSEQARQQLQQSLQVIDRSQLHDDSELNSLRESIRCAQEEITRLKNCNHEQAVKLQVAEQEKQKAVRSVRQYVVQSGVKQNGEESTAEDEGSERASMSRGSRAELVKACRRANRELRQHRLYLDQLLAIVIERQPEILSMVAEAQKMRDLVDSESWC